MKIKRYTGVLIISLSFLVFMACASNSAANKENEAEVQVKEVTENKSENSISKEEKASSKKTKKKNAEDEISGWKKSKIRPVEVDYGSIKLRAKTKLGTFNIAIIDDEKNKVFPAFATSNEYSTTGLFLKTNGKIIRLNEDTRVKYSAWKTDSGMKLGYRIENIADVVVNFECFQSSSDYDLDTVKVSITVTNMGKKKTDFAVKAILDTILGETDRHHFYTWENAPVKNEIGIRNFEENPWFLSKNNAASLQMIFTGAEATNPEILAFANYSTLNNRGWEPDLLTYRAFDTILSYNNSACGIIWPKRSVGVKEQFTEVFYLSTSTGDRIPYGAEKLGIPVPANGKTYVVKESAETAGENENSNIEEVKSNKKQNSIRLDSKTLTQEQLSNEYIKKLLDRISVLEEADDNLNNDELQQLNAELDAILEALRM